MIEKNCFNCGTAITGKTLHKQACASCRDALIRERDRVRAEKVRRAKGIPTVKGTTGTCARCASGFSVTGYSRQRFCAPCATETARERARERVNRLSRERGAPKIGDAFTCTRCATPFNRRASREQHCDDCKRLPDAVRWPHLAERQKKAASRYRERVRSDPVRQERVKVLAREKRQRRKLNPAFTINERMSAAVRASLTFGKQGSSWEDLVGYSLSDLMEHLESKFKPGMSWANRGEWHIDHIIPLSWFRFDTTADEQFRQCWALSNLQPLFAEDNIRKNNRLPGVFE